MKAIYIKDFNSQPEVIEFDGKLKTSQSLVQGLIEYTYWKDIAIICNEEGKINRLAPSRALIDTQGKVHDVIAGPMIIVPQEEGDVLTDEQIERFTNEFALENLCYKFAV